MRASTHKLDDVCNASDIWDDLEEFVLDNQNGSTSTDNGYSFLTLYIVRIAKCEKRFGVFVILA